ncbi:DUF2332 domain-containing protein [Goodfellowiella coeruleoviolacea]|uniref:DUF2332 domain-containing protein n=1 Tax=Goodfellowiella coeruleoviolacea TaxID=334858 RepID=A0AAE3GK27_9PSEU|nr:DUF2332 domain-containing protein [Goodfellowiella coeruleoviolacea]MCP2168794.1 hypothetical protein [Goodfellowiella coeruleoviolacea]
MLAKLFSDTALGCRNLSPLTHALLVGAAADLTAGGVTSEIMAGCERDRQGSVPGLRFAGAVHRMVLEGKAPALAKHYPSVGGSPDLDTLWSDALPALRDNAAELRHRVRATVVQTNEPGRNGPLYGGLLTAAQQAAEAAGRRTPFPVRLLEVGASGGLNLRPHRIAYRMAGNGHDVVLGDPNSPFVLDPEWTGLPEADLSRNLRVVARAGCDLNPVDVSTQDGQLHLSSFVWADQLDRWHRLRAALDLAASDPVRVARASGPEWLEQQLAHAERDVLTVVSHSVVWQYVSPADRARGRAVLAEAAARATPQSPLALLVYEPRRSGGERSTNQRSTNQRFGDQQPGDQRSGDSRSGREEPASRNSVVHSDNGFPYRFYLLLKLWPVGVSLRLGTGSGHGIPFHWDCRPWN